MEWIEILGVPGAGKTSLLHNLENNSVSNNIKQTWYAEQAIKFGIIENIKKGNFELANKLLKAKILSNQRLKNKNRWNELIRVHQEGVESLELPVEFKFKLNSFYSSLINKISKYSNLNLSKPIFLDEGLIHNTYAKYIDIQNFIRQNYFMPRLVVYLEADILEVANEIKHSNSFEARGIKQFNSFSVTEIRDLLLKKASQTQDKIKFLEKNKVPVIKLNRMNSHHPDDLTRINRRINEILKKDI